MRRSRIAVVGVVALGAAIGVGVAGFPSSGSDVPVHVVASSDAPAGVTSAPAASAVEVSTTTEASTTTTLPLRPPAEVTVLVANASGVRGAAAAVSAEVGAAGYVVADPIDATNNAAITVVSFVAGFDREADDLAARLGLPAGSVGPMPFPTPVDDLAGAQLVVVVGSDRAA